MGDRGVVHVRVLVTVLAHARVCTRCILLVRFNCRYRRSVDTDAVHRYRRFRSLLRLYRVCIDEVFRLYRRSIEYRDVCIEYRRAGLGVWVPVESE